MKKNFLGWDGTIQTEFEDLNWCQIHFWRSHPVHGRKTAAEQGQKELADFQTRIDRRTFRNAIATMPSVGQSRSFSSHYVWPKIHRRREETTERNAGNGPKVAFFIKVQRYSRHDSTRPGDGSSKILAWLNTASVVNSKCQSYMWKGDQFQFVGRSEGEKVISYVQGRGLKEKWEENWKNDIFLRNKSNLSQISLVSLSDRRYYCKKLNFKNIVEPA